MTYESSPISGSRVRDALPWLLALIAAAALLRLLYLGNTFQSSDNAELAVRILTNDGYAWMLEENYGLLINLLVKLSAGVVSGLGVGLTEFWWKAPVALFGIVQVPVTYAFLRRLGGSREAGLWSAALAAVLPIHVMQSRYLWGYEVLGSLFLTLALWSLVAFFSRPGWKQATLASLASGLYLISHGYILPFFLSLPLIAALLGPGGDALGRMRNGLGLLVTRLVWVVPLLLFPLYMQSLIHTQERVDFSFHLGTVRGFVQNVGIPLAFLLAASVPAALASPRLRSPAILMLSGVGALYLAPLFVFTSQLTVVRGYMLVGTLLLVKSAILAVDRLDVSFTRRTRILLGVVLALTTWGTVESVFYRDALVDPSRVRVERGGLDLDPGTRTAGYLVRQHVPESSSVLAIHRSVEPPNFFYYFGREEGAYFDLRLERTLDVLADNHPSADLVICEGAQVAAVEALGQFEQRVVIVSRGEPRMWLYARPGVPLPALRADVEDFNPRFDSRYPVRASLF